MSWVYSSFQARAPGSPKTSAPLWSLGSQMKKWAPSGSCANAIRPEVEASLGSMVSEPPRSLIRSAVSSALLTVK